MNDHGKLTIPCVLIYDDKLAFIGRAVLTGDGNGKQFPCVIICNYPDFLGEYHFTGVAYSRGTPVYKRVTNEGQNAIP